MGLAEQLCAPSSDELALSVTAAAAEPRMQQHPSHCMAPDAGEDYGSITLLLKL